MGFGSVDVNIEKNKFLLKNSPRNKKFKIICNYLPLIEPNLLIFEISNNFKGTQN